MLANGKRVVVHVGAHKTGTTVVQQYLQSHPRDLARARVRYHARRELTPYVGWGEQLVDAPEGLHALLTRFRRDPRSRVLLASHENICGRAFVAGKPGLYPSAGPAVDALHALLEPFRTTIVLTVRPQHELLESYYLQSINLGGRLPFDRWLAGIDQAALSWRPLVDRLAGAFGRDAVEIVDFAVIRAGSAAYVQHFLARAGLDLAVDETWRGSLNPSLSARGLRMALAGNAAVTTAAERRLLRQFLQRNFSNATGSRPVLLDDDLRRRLTECYAGEYADLVKPAA